MDLFKVKENVKLATSLIVGFSVTKVVKDGVYSVAEIEGKRDAARVRVASLAIGGYVSHRVKSYLDDEIDDAFQMIDNALQWWRFASEEGDDENVIQGDATEDELPQDGP